MQFVLWQEGEGEEGFCKETTELGSGHDRLFSLLSSSSSSMCFVSWNALTYTLSEEICLFAFSSFFLWSRKMGCP